MNELKMDQALINIDVCINDLAVSASCGECSKIQMSAETCKKKRWINEKEGHGEFWVQFVKIQVIHE